MLITKHAEKRIRKRLGVPRSAVDKIAQDAFDNGIRHSEVSGRVKRFIDGQFLHNENHADNIRIHNRYVFIFKKDTLITVFGLPERLR